MLSVIAPKREYYYLAEWVQAGTQKRANFRFRIVKDDNMIDDMHSNMEGLGGQFIIETNSTINFMPEDIVEFKNARFIIDIVDGNRKIDGEMAFGFVKNNGRLPVTLTLSRLG